MSQHERTGERDLTYHRWHRYDKDYTGDQLGFRHFLTDIDAVEYRADDGGVRLVGIYEVKREGWRETPSSRAQMQVIRTIATACGIPGWRLVYWPVADKDGLPPQEWIERFHFTDLLTNEKRNMTPAQYREFLRSLPM